MKWLLALEKRIYVKGWNYNGIINGWSQLCFFQRFVFLVEFSYRLIQFHANICENKVINMIELPIIIVKKSSKDWLHLQYCLHIFIQIQCLFLCRYLTMMGTDCSAIKNLSPWWKIGWTEAWKLSAGRKVGVDLRDVWNKNSDQISHTIQNQMIHSIFFYSLSSIYSIFECGCFNTHCNTH